MGSLIHPIFDFAVMVEHPNFAKMGRFSNLFRRNVQICRVSAAGAARDVFQHKVRDGIEISFRSDQHQAAESRID
jgi:hypothetical protein